MRIVITGATGNLGSALIRRLTRPGEPAHELVGVARRPPASGPPFDGLTWHGVDLTDDTAAARLQTVMIGADAVVHLAWGFQPSRDPDYLRRLGVGGTVAVLTAVRAAGVPHLVHTSSVGAYRGAPDKPRVDESWPTDGVPSSPYSLHKAAAEARLDADQRAHPDSDLTVTRIRPGFVVQRSAGSALLRYGVPGYVPARALGWLPVLPLDRSLRIPLVHADDVADALARIVERRVGGAFNLAGEPAISRDDIADALGARAIHVPGGVLRTAVDLTWRARLQQLDPGWIDLAFAVPLLDTGRARRELDWAPVVETRAALREVVAGMRDAASGPSSVLRRRTIVDDVRSRIGHGSIGNRRRP